MDAAQTTKAVPGDADHHETPWQTAEDLAWGPLTGLRVLDLSRLLAGPYATMILGDLGADVIKVEKPKHGDETRFTDSMVVGDSGYYLGLNRNKRAITVDIRTPEGQQAVRRLSADADVVVENFRLGYLAERGLGYDDLSAQNPRLIYCSISGYGRQGPLVSHPGMDILAQAICGLMSITGEADRPPARIGPPISDFGASLLGTIGILAALQARHVTGHGQHVHLSLMSASLALVANYSVGALNSDNDVPRLGSGHPQIVPYQALETSDGYVIVGVINKKFWIRFCELLELEHLTYDDRFAQNSDRIQNRMDLIELVEERTRTASTAHWIELFEGADIPCPRVNTLREALNHEQVEANHLTEVMNHPRLGPLRFVGLPYDLSDTPGSLRMAPPDHGQHTDEVLGALGFDPPTIARMRDAGIV